jgi:hypothetical protein
MERPRLLRYVRIAVTAFSLTACVLLVGLWVRSYWWSDHAYCPLPSSNMLVVNSWQGRLSSYAGEQPGAFPSGWGTMSRYVVNTAERNSRSRPSWGFDSDQRGREFLFPHWLPVLISAALAAAVNIRLRQFSLRTLLIATALVAVGLGMVVYLAR